MKVAIMPYIKRHDTTRFPLRLENLEKWEGIFQSVKSQGILNRLENSDKILEMLFVIF